MWEFLSSLAGYFEKGGLHVMLPLVLGAAALWYALGYRVVALRRGNRRSVRVMVDRYFKGDDRKPRGIVDTAVVRGVLLVKEGKAPLRRHLDETFSDLEQDLNRYSTLIRSVVISAPLLGLLGTVMGMIETFDSLGDMSLFSQSGGIAGGISQALFTTQMGLAVSIPGLIVGRILDRRQVLIETELDKLKDILCTTKA